MKCVIWCGGERLSGGLGEEEEEWVEEYLVVLY